MGVDGYGIICLGQDGVILHIVAQLNTRDTAGSKELQACTRVKSLEDGIGSVGNGECRGVGLHSLAIAPSLVKGGVQVQHRDKGNETLEAGSHLAISSQRGADDDSVEVFADVDAEEAHAFEGLHVEAGVTTEEDIGILAVQIAIVEVGNLLLILHLRGVAVAHGNIIYVTATAAVAVDSHVNCTVILVRCRSIGRHRPRQVLVLFHVTSGDSRAVSIDGIVNLGSVAVLTHIEGHTTGTAELMGLHAHLDGSTGSHMRNHKVGVALRAQPQVLGTMERAEVGTVSFRTVRIIQSDSQTLCLGIDILHTCQLRDVLAVSLYHTCRTGSSLPPALVGRRRLRGVIVAFLIICPVSVGPEIRGRRGTPLGEVP